MLTLTKNFFKKKVLRIDKKGDESCGARDSVVNNVSAEENKHWTMRV